MWVSVLARVYFRVLKSGDSLSWHLPAPFPTVQSEWQTVFPFIRQPINLPSRAIACEQIKTTLTPLANVSS